MQNGRSRRTIALARTALLVLSMLIPRAAEFVQTPAPSNANQAGFITRLPNGEVLVFGSTIKSNLPTAEIYSPVTHTWRAGNPSPIPVGLGVLLRMADCWWLAACGPTLRTVFFTPKLKRLLQFSIGNRKSGIAFPT